MKAMLVFRWSGYCLLIVSMLVLVSPGLRAEPVTYFGITFPHGDAAFADRVVDYSAASCVRAAFDDPVEALGPPDAYCDGCEGCDGCDTNAVSLGFRLSVIDNRGYLVLEFVDNVLADVPGDDLFVYNTNRNPALVEISTDGHSFIAVGKVVGYPGAIDIAAYVNANDAFRYVRLSDVPGDEDRSNCPGPSIDAVGVMGHAEAVITGEAFGSLELLPVGDLSLAFDGAADKLLVILDVSSSMLEIIDGEVKMDVAKDVLVALLADLPTTVRVGIRIFGFNCSTELIAPVGLIQHAHLQQQIMAIQPRGATPIALALTETKDDLTDMTDPQMILLISDGMETCGGDPVQAARDLIALGYDLRINVIGFDITRNIRARDQLVEIAQAAGGLYFDAGSAEELRAAMSMATPFGYTVYDADGNVVFTGQLGDSGPQLPEGVYTIVIGTDPPIRLTNVLVQEHRTTMIKVEQTNGGYQAEVGN